MLLSNIFILTNSSQAERVKNRKINIANKSNDSGKQCSSKYIKVTSECVQVPGQYEYNMDKKEIVFHCQGALE